MASSAIQDPFYVVKEEVLSSFNSAKQLYARWKDLYDSGNIHDNHEFDWTQAELVNQLRNIEWDLEDVEESVQIAETHRMRYRLDPQELQSRRFFVTSTRQAIQDMRRAVMDPAVKQKKEVMQREALLQSTAGMQERDKFAKARQAVEEDNERFVENAQAQQQVMIQQQDQDLTQLEDTLARLGEIGVAIGQEAELHNQLLTETNEEADKVQGRLDSAMKEIKKTIEAAKSNGFICMIATLIIILVVLVILVFTLK